jgi:predicted transcriptional regulator
MLIKRKTNIKKNLHYKILELFNSYVYMWNLSETEVKVFAALYDKLFEIKKTVSDIKIRMNVLFSKESKTEIITNLNISYNTFNNALTTLRKKGFIKNNTLDEKLCFDIHSKEFKITIHYIDE